MLPAMRIRLSASEEDARGGIRRVREDARQLGKELDRTGAAAGRASRRLSGMTSRNRNMRSSVQNTAYQFQDMAVQISGGTDAMRAMSMQLPQLLGGMGVAGAVVGALVAVALPLASAMKGLVKDGREVTEVFGTLAPAAEAVARGMASVAVAFSEFGSLVVNNIDRIITIGATAAAFFAGKWVAGMVAARVATLTFAGSLIALRTALIRTGIGALVIGAGELVFQFTRLSRAAGGFGEAVGLLKDVFSESFGRMGSGVDVLVYSFQLAAAKMQSFFLTALHNMLWGFDQLTTSVANGFNGLFGTDIKGSNSSGLLEGAIGGANADANLASINRKGALADLTKPLQSLRAIRDLMAGMKEENLTLKDIFNFGDDDGDDPKRGGGGSDKEKTNVEMMLEALDNLVNGTKKGLSEALGAWGAYFSDLVSLTGSSNQRLLALAKSFGAGQALINAWQAHNETLKDPSLPWWGRIAAAANVFAAGVGAVNAIKGVSAGGGSAGGAPVSSASAVTAAAPQPLEATLNLQGPLSDLFAGSISSLLDDLNKEAGDRGYRLMVAAA